jgi:ATP-dependent Clp protease ATP-binding subunit ClpA
LTPPSFSDRALHVVMAGYQDAAGRGHETYGPRHLMLALLSDEGCAAHRALTASGVTYQAADALVGCYTYEMCPSMPWIERGIERALVHALCEVGRSGEQWAGTGHLLCGALHDPQDSGAYLMTLLRVDPARVRSQVTFDEGPAAVPYPLQSIKIVGQRALALIDDLVVRCARSAAEERPT